MNDASRLLERAELELGKTLTLLELLRLAEPELCKPIGTAALYETRDQLAAIRRRLANPGQTDLVDYLEGAR